MGSKYGVEFGSSTFLSWCQLLFLLIHRHDCDLDSLHISPRLKPRISLLLALELRDRMNGSIATGENLKYEIGGLRLGNWGAGIVVMGCSLLLIPLVHGIIDGKVIHHPHHG